MPSFLRFSQPGRDLLLGVLLALGCAVLMVAVIYALLAVRAVFYESSVPAAAGLVVFALLHGGAASVEVPPIPELFGLGGSLRLGLPVTSFALIPFLASLLAARFAAHQARTPGLFILVSALTYAIVVAVLAALGTASTVSGEMTIRLESDPLSTALRGFLWVGLGAMLGTAASRGPLLPARVRQVLRGALWAVGVSLAVAFVLAVVIALSQQVLGTTGNGPEQAPGQAPLPQAPEVLTPATPGVSDVGGALEAIGMVFALLPVALGNLWLLAHGVPVGFQRAPDLGEIPLVGEALAGVPLRVALLGNWPWGVAWRLLLLAPVVGLVVGGMVAARGAPAGSRWRQGALVALPYAAIALLTAVLVGTTADVTLAEAASLKLAFRASLAWLLLLLPVGAVLGAAGGLLSRADAFPVPHPNRSFLVACAVGGIVLLGSLPTLAALFPGETQPSGPLASEGQPFSSPPSSESPETETPEATPPPQEDASPRAAEQGGVDSPADPVFDPLLPTLRQKTSAPIMLPSNLPEELENVAVDADRSGSEYGVLFLGRPSESIEQSYVHANDVGTIVAASEPQYGASDVFEATKEEQVTLEDGTEATLRYMEPKEGEMVNQGPYWEGSFEKDGHKYFVTVPLADPSGDVARQTLTSMVEVPDEGSSGDESGSPGEGARQEGPAPGYNMIQTPDGSLSAEVPQSWGVETGEDSEKDGTGPGTWSYHAGEYLSSSITTAPNLDVWYSAGSSGVYFVASKSLAQGYTDQELTRSLYFAKRPRTARWVR